MSTNSIDIATRAKNNDQLLQSQLRRCQSLEQEAQALTSGRKSADRTVRALFVTDLISEAQNKLVECQLAAPGLNTNDETAIARLATIERWTKSAVDLLNQAYRVLEEDEDIWGRPIRRPEHWDK